MTYDDILHVCFLDSQLMCFNPQTSATDSHTLSFAETAVPKNVSTHCPQTARARGGTFAKRANCRTTAGAGLQQHPHLLQLFELLRPLASTRVALSIARYCKCRSMRTSAADKCSAVSLDSELSLLAVAHPVHQTGDQDIKKNQQRNWHSS